MLVMPAVRLACKSVNKPEYIVVAHVLYLIRPLAIEAAQRPVDLWTVGIRKLQDLLYAMYAHNPEVSLTLKDALNVWIRVHIERMLVAPPAAMPRNGPRIVLELMGHLDDLIFGGCVLQTVYGLLLRHLDTIALGPNATVLDDPEYHVSPPKPGLVERLLAESPNIGKKLQRIIRSRDSHMSEVFLRYLAKEAIPADKARGWAEDIPWEHVLHIIMQCSPYTTQAMLSYAFDIWVLLGFAPQ
jgi:hypothetical protein